MSDCGEFYRLRDLRTRAYTTGEIQPSRPVVIGAGPDATRSVAGQFLLLTLANLLARVHRRIIFVLSGAGDGELLTAGPSDASSLQEALVDVAEEIDPCGHFSVRDPPPDAEALRVGVGADAPDGFRWHVGAKGSIAILAREPVPIADDFGPGTLRGAGLAACLAASVPFQVAHDIPLRPHKLSAWNYSEGEDACLGPSGLEAPDPGRVLMVGAGAVGSSLAYWLQAWGTRGEWTVVDPDVVKLHNTNRTLLFTAADAGWPAGRHRRKAHLVAKALPDSTAVDRLYRDAESVHDEAFDVVLPLANEGDVRARLAGRNATVVLHATTGPNYVSQLHRHLKGRDDCIACRMADVAPAAMKCSTVEVGLEDGEEEVGDAALPYLSAASGLMLATALQRLLAGDLARPPTNCWSWYFASERAMVQRVQYSCREGCRSVLPDGVRAVVARDRLWTNLDPAIGQGA